MKNIVLKFVTVALLVLNLAACGKEATNPQVSTTKSSAVKTSTTATSSTKVATSAEPTQTVSEGTKPSSSVTEASDTPKQATTQSEAQSVKEEPTSSVTTSPVEETSPPSQSDISQVGKGSATVTSGTLELHQETPVYSQPDKTTGVAFKYPAGSVNWDKYFQENGDDWYSYVSYDGIRYYIAYSDVGH